MPTEPQQPRISEELGKKPEAGNKACFFSLASRMCTNIAGPFLRQATQQQQQVHSPTLEGPTCHWNRVVVFASRSDGGAVFCEGHFEPPEHGITYQYHITDTISKPNKDKIIQLKCGMCYLCLRFNECSSQPHCDRAQHSNADVGLQPPNARDYDAP